jgi:hypothetical protein
VEGQQGAAEHGEDPERHPRERQEPGRPAQGPAWVRHGQHRQDQRHDDAGVEQQLFSDEQLHRGKEAEQHGGAPPRPIQHGQAHR